VFFELALTPGPGEEATFVFEGFQVNDKCAFEFGFGEDHDCSLC
jgi:hypothetical protein